MASTADAQAVCQAGWTEWGGAWLPRLTRRRCVRLGGRSGGGRLASTADAQAVCQAGWTEWGGVPSHRGLRKILRVKFKP
jgi:hypothetical protein